jgi:hypothetical protein
MVKRPILNAKKKKGYKKTNIERQKEKGGWQKTCSLNRVKIIPKRIQ